jgi:hypothetical protein
MTSAHFQEKGYINGMLSNYDDDDHVDGVRPGPYYTSGTLGTVPRAYEEIEGEKNTEMKDRKM